jgi:starvation-inducible DNA-binding protein
MIDVLAERARKLGGITIHSIGEINRLKNIEDNDEAFVESHKMVQFLLEDNKELVESLRKAHKISEEANDVATASFLEIYIDETERRVWFLYETIVGDSGIK